MGGWGEYIAAWAVFLLSHSVPVRPPVRNRLIAIMGRRGYLIGYSVLSVVILVWLFRAAARAPWVGLWSMPVAGPWIVLGAMALAITILSLGLFRPNPLSFGGTSGDFDPGRAGVLRWVRHPILTAAAIWALAHMVVNGDLAHVILFGGFAGFALLGMVMIDRRNRRRIGAEAWRDMHHRMRVAPAVPDPTLVLRLGGAVVAVVTLLTLHRWIAGVAVLPYFGL